MDFRTLDMDTDSTPFLDKSVESYSEAASDRLKELVDSDKNSMLSNLDQTQVYRRRWWILFVYCTCAIISGILFLTWATLSDTMMIAYNWTNGFEALINGLGNASIVLWTFPMMMLIQTYGLRVGMILSTSCLVAASIMWNIALAAKQSWLVPTGSLFVGASFCIPLAAPTLLSVSWFPVNERNTATGFAAISPFMGMGIAYITGPSISGAHVTVEDVQNKANLSIGYILGIQNGIKNVVYFDTGLSLLCLILVITYFPSIPPTPPSRSRTAERENFGLELKHLITSSQFWIVIIIIAFSPAGGSFAAWLPLITISMRSLNVGEVEAGNIAFLTMTISSVGSIPISWLSDRLKRQTKAILKVSTVCAIALIAVLACVQAKFICVPQQSMTAVLYTLCIAIGLCTNGVGPLYCELAAESFYPVDEGTTMSAVSTINALISMLLFGLFLIPSLANDTHWMIWTMLGATAIALPFLMFVKDHYPRLDMEEEYKKLKQPMIRESDS